MNDLSLVTIVIILIVLLLVFLARKASRNSVDNLILHESLKTSKSIWDEHPMKKYYFVLRIFFYTCLISWGLAEYFDKDRLDSHLSLLMLIVVQFFLLMIVRCPKCKSSLFLQEMNTFSPKAPALCIKCGYPSVLTEGSSVNKNIAIRPVFKWAFYIFLVLPTLALIVAKVTGRLK